MVVMTKQYFVQNLLRHTVDLCCDSQLMMLYTLSCIDLHRRISNVHVVLALCNDIGVA